MTFDTLSYAGRLRQAGVPDQQAEAMADATREFIAQDVATKTDIASVRSDLAALELRLRAEMETLSLRLTVRLGVMMAAGFSLMTALLSLLSRLR